MLLWGPPSKFVAGRWDPKQENSEIRAIDDGRTAPRLLNWINKQIGRRVLLGHSCLDLYDNQNMPYLIS